MELISSYGFLKNYPLHKESKLHPYYHLVPKDPIENAEYREWLLNRMDEDVEFARDQWKMCRDDILYYINAHGWTYDPRPDSAGGALSLPFITWNFQDAVLSDSRSKLGLQSMFWEKSRDMGVTWMIIYLIEHDWHFFKLKNHLMMSRKKDLVDSRSEDSLFRKIDYIHSRLHPALLPTGRVRGENDPNRVDSHVKNIDLSSAIDGEPTTGDVSAGGRRGVIFFDEFSRVYGDEGFEVLDASREATNCRIFCSTPKGTDNAYAQIGEVAKGEDSVIQVYTLHWVLHPRKSQGLYTVNHNGEPEILDKKWHENYEKREGHPYPFDLNPHFPTPYRFRSPEYDRAVKESANMQSIAQNWDIDYTGSAFQLISAEVIAAHVEKHVKEPLAIGNFFNGFSEDKKGGKWKLWTTLGPHGDANPSIYVMGIDISMGTGASNSAISIVDTRTRRKVAEFACPHTKPKELAKIAAELGHVFKGPQGPALMLPDANGASGASFLKEVIKLNYGNFYYMKDSANKNKRSPKPGFYSKRDGNEELLNDYAHALANDTFINPSEISVRESAEYVVTPQGIKYMKTSIIDPTDAKARHGDRVWADALACMAMGAVLPEDHDIEPEVAPYSWKWFKDREDLVTVETYGARYSR